MSLWDQDRRFWLFDDEVYELFDANTRKMIIDLTRSNVKVLEFTPKQVVVLVHMKSENVKRVMDEHLENKLENDDKATLIMTGNIRVDAHFVRYAKIEHGRWRLVFEFPEE